MRVQKGPDELAADVFKAELKVRVLVHRMVTAVKRGRPNLQPLFVGNLFRANDSRRVTSARRRNRRIIGMREVIAQSDTGSGGLKLNVIRVRRSHRVRCHRSRAILHRWKGGE